MSKVPMTVAGERRLREELARLKTVERPRISAAIGSAREHGDLRENAEYHAAKEQQGLCEARVREIEAKLGNAQVIDIARIAPNGRVMFGATVALRNLDGGEPAAYQIVGEDEADVAAGRISVTSPIARAAMGRSEGDEIVVKAPAGDIRYEIESIRHL